MRTQFENQQIAVCSFAVVLLMHFYKVSMQLAWTCPALWYQKVKDKHSENFKPYTETVC